MSGSALARTHFALVAAALLAIPAQLLAQATGTVEGTVIDAGNRRPVPSVQVSIMGTGGTVGALTNAQGEFRILNVAAGQRTVRLRRLGYVAITKTVDVAAGGTTNVAIELSPSAVELNAIVTTGTGGSQIE